jgi:DNA modification methylase
MVFEFSNEIINGDAREVLPTLPDNSVDMIFTDPPYGIDYENGAGRNLYSPARDDMQGDGCADDADELVRVLLLEANRILTPGAVICICCGGAGKPGNIQRARWELLVDKHMDYVHTVVWDKRMMGTGTNYRRSWEAVIVAQKRMRPQVPMVWFGRPDTENIIRNVSRLPNAPFHSTQKPVALATWFIWRHTPPGALVLDPFAGSGSTLRAAANGGCRFLGIEIDETHCKTARANLRQEVFDLWEHSTS